MAAGREEAQAAFGFLLVLARGSDSGRAWPLESRVGLELGGKGLEQEPGPWPRPGVCGQFTGHCA